MTGNRRVLGDGLPRLALGVFVTLVVALGLTCLLAPRETLGDEELPLQAQGDEELPLQAQGDEEPPLQAQGEEEPLLQAQDSKVSSPYGLWVGNTPVTYENKDDVLKGTTNEGKVRFSPASGQTPAKLTLNGANITTGHTTDDGSSYGIHYTAKQGPLTIAVASDSTVDVSGLSGDITVGIFSETSESSDLTITGAGKLTAKGKYEGISSGHSVTIDNGAIVAIGGNSGINARAGDVVINGGTVEANGGIFGTTVTINGGAVKANSLYGNSVTISGGEVTAIASEGNGITASSTNYEPGTVKITGGTVIATGGAEGYGIYVQASLPEMPGSVTITGGTVSATGGVNGIYAQPSSNPEAPGNVTIDGSITSVIASGDTRAVEGAVTNAVAGMGWTDAAGTQDKTAIEAKADGQVLDAYKKVQFPTPVAKVTAPEATNPTYDGNAQALVTAGTAEGGTMAYSLDGKEYSPEVPTAAEVGEYTVWYMAVGDAQHADSEAQSLTSTIAEPIDAIGLVARGHVQNVGDVNGESSGKGVKVGTEGRSLRLEAFGLSLPKDVEGGIEYRGHIQNKGWDEWVADGKPCGTTNQALRLEAVQVRLTGKLAKTHDVWYRVHAQNFGTLGWAKDDQAAGTAGQALRVESLEVQVLPTGETPADYEEGKASYVGAATADVHVQNAGWTGAQSALEFGTTGQSRRLEAVRVTVPGLPVGGGVSYEVHAQDRGWMLPAAVDGALAGTEGQSRRLEAVRISLTGDAAKKGNFSVWYRVHSQDYGWLGWAHDGQEAGTTGLGKRAEAIDVQVLPQGQLPRGYDAGRAASVNG